MLLFNGGSSLAQQEIAFFKLSDISADFRVRYLQDDRAADVNNVKSQFWTEELWVRTRSYIYHPAFLNMAIAGGPILLQQSYANNQGRNSENETLLTYDARFNFLARKTYPFSVSATRDYSEMTTNLLGRYLARTDTFGLNGALTPREAPFFAAWNVGHISAVGSGYGSTVDEDGDLAAIATSLTYLNDQSVKLNLDWSKRASNSGSADLPIQRSLIETFSANLIGDNVMGPERNIRFNQNIRMQSQDTTIQDTSTMDRVTYSGILRWQHSERINPNVSYFYTDEERDATWSRNQVGRISNNFEVSDRLQFSASADISSSESPGYSADRKAIIGNASYRVPLAFGEFAMTGSVRYRRTDQVATASTIQVFDEPHVLTGVAPERLGAEFVLTDTVFVTNSTQTQTFSEGIDYRLVTIGGVTTIERLIAGNIADGQEVLVSYEYQAGGTSAYDTQGQGIGFSLLLYKNARIYLNFDNTDNNVISGFNTVPLNDTKSVNAGATLDLPLWGDWLVGARVHYARSLEDISPSESSIYDLYAQTAVFWRTAVKFGLSQTNVDNKLSDEDVDALRYYVELSCRLPGAVQLSYSYVASDDDGGSIVREDTTQNLQFDWRYRQVQLALQARHVEYNQGATNRTDTHVRAELRRTF